MNLKWLGAFLVMAGCGGMGFLLAWNYKREVSVLRNLAEALEYMACDLEYRLTSLPELCKKTAEKQSGSLRAVFLALAQELDSQISPDAAFCMSAALKRTPEIPKRAAKTLEALGNSLGLFDLPGQLKGIQSVQASCLQELAILEKERTQRTRSYQTLGLCAGAALAILFL